MSDKLSDAELVERLKLLAAHNGVITDAARTMGVARSAFSASIQDAKKRGLSAGSDVVTPEAKLRTKSHSAWLAAM